MTSIARRLPGGVARARDLLAASGPFAVVAVLAGSASFGLALAQALGSGYGLPFDALAIACVAGAVVALGTLWYCSCTAWSSHDGIPIVALLRSDAVAYGALVTYPLVAIPFHGRAGSHVAVAVALCAFVTAKAVVTARYDAAVRATLASFAVSRVLVLAGASIGALHFARHVHTAHFSKLPLLALWANWDAAHYLSIAQRGYSGTDMAFFPFYPTLIRAVGALVGDDLIAAIVISNVALFVALTLLRSIVSEQFGARAGARAVAFAAFFPMSFFFSAAYSESLFFALSLGTVYAIRRGHWMTAGLVGGLAALTRVEGSLLFVLFAFEIAAPETGLLAMARSSTYVRRYLVLAASLIPLGLLVYMFLLFVLCGDPLYFMHVQSHWNRHLAPPWFSIERSVDLILHARDRGTIAVQSVELAFTTAVVATLALGRRELRTSYLAYAVVSLLVPLSTTSLMSTPRFALVLFPVYIVLAAWSRRPGFTSTVLGIFVPLLVFFSGMFAAYYWVA